MQPRPSLQQMTSVSTTDLVGPAAQATNMQAYGQAFIGMATCGGSGGHVPHVSAQLSRHLDRHFSSAAHHAQSPAVPWSWEEPPADETLLPKASLATRSASGSSLRCQRDQHFATREQHRRGKRQQSEVDAKTAAQARTDVQDLTAQQMTPQQAGRPGSAHEAARLYWRRAEGAVLDSCGMPCMWQWLHAGMQLVLPAFSSVHTKVVLGCLYATYQASRRRCSSTTTSSVCGCDVY
jgi:hypothetical protein